MEIIFIIGGIWIAGHIFGWWEQRPPPKTAEQLLEEQQEREQRERELQTHLELQRVEWERQKAERREAWQAAYGEYLRSDKWQRVRQRVFKRAEYKCEFCGAPRGTGTSCTLPEEFPSHELQAGEHSNSHYGVGRSVPGEQWRPLPPWRGMSSLQSENIV